MPILTTRPRSSGWVWTHKLFWLAAASIALVTAVVWTFTAVQQSEAAPAQPGDVPSLVNIEKMIPRLAPVDRGLNANTESIAEALEKRMNPERLSASFMPEAFDTETFKRDPQAYLDVVEPGRAFQTLRPGDDVPALEAIGSNGDYVEVFEGETAVLLVEAPPGAPVTFTSLDAGAFENSLPSITVQANRSGRARAVFEATAGTSAYVEVLAGSPMAAEQVPFLIRIIPDK